MTMTRMIATNYNHDNHNDHDNNDDVNEHVDDDDDCNGKRSNGGSR